METFLEILKYILPSLVVVLVVWLMLRKGLANEAERRNFELRKQTANQMTPTRLRAYERFTLFLERTKPEAMLLRYDNLSSMTTATLQQKLLIRHYAPDRVSIFTRRIAFVYIAIFSTKCSCGIKIIY